MRGGGRGGRRLRMETADAQSSPLFLRKRIELRRCLLDAEFAHEIRNSGTSATHKHRNPTATLLDLAHTNNHVT